MLRAAPLMLLMLPLSAFAGSAEIIKAVEAKYATVETLSAGFTQTTKSELYGSAEQVGTMTIKRPAKMSWTFTADGKQFITDGATMWIYTPADKQVLQFDDVSQAAGSADSVLQSLDKISEMFEVQVLEETEASKRLALKPKAADAQVKRIELQLDKDLVVQNVTILDAFDTQTALAFKDMKLDAKVDDSVFAFQPPEGVEVIKGN